jgi:hypothetical protein
VQEDTSASCPFGEVNDAYPGKCHRYVDSNQDGFCDLGVSRDVEVAADPTSQEGEEVELAALSADTSTGAAASNEKATAVPTITPAPTATVEILAPPEPTTVVEPTATAASARVQTLCPRGLVNDPYPGRCRRYIDRNGNGFCDLSQVA